MTDKLKKDFSDSMTIDKAILLGELGQDVGTIVLYDMIDYIKKDIQTMSEKAAKLLEKAVEEVNKDREKKKESIRKASSPGDSAEMRDLEMALLREDYEACKRILFFIQNLAFREGWFE